MPRRDSNACTTKTAIVFGSKRLPYISLPLRTRGIHVHEVYSWGFRRRIAAPLKLYKLSKNLHPAYLIVDTPHWTGLAALIVTSILRQQYFLVLRGNVFAEFKSIFAAMMNKKILTAARGIIFLSQYLQAAVLENVPHLRRHAVIPCPYLITPPAPRAPRKRQILTVTQFHFLQKAQPLLQIIPVIDSFLDTYPDVSWHICGGGRYLNLASTILQRMNNRTRIFLHGHCSNLDAFYQNSAVFLYASGLDTFSLAISEAYLHGLPVIANNAMGFADRITEGEDGFLFDMATSDWPKKLHECLNLLLQAPSLAEEMGLKGRRKVIETCNLERIGLLLETFLSQPSGV